MPYRKQQGTTRCLPSPPAHLLLARPQNPKLPLQKVSNSAPATPKPAPPPAPTKASTSNPYQKTRGIIIVIKMAEEMDIEKTEAQAPILVFEEDDEFEEFEQGDWDVNMEDPTDLK